MSISARRLQGINNMLPSGGGDTTPPTVPTNLTATVQSSSSITLTWAAATDNVGVTKYNVYRGSTKVGSPAGTTFTDSGLNAGTAYNYYVVALDAAGNQSAHSNTASATTQSGGNPSQTSTIFGFNASPGSSSDQKMLWWGRCPIGRGYYGYSTLPSNGSGFQPGGKEYKMAGLHLADQGVVSSKRINISSRFDPSTITSASSAKVVETVNYAKSVPAGWKVYICWHEYDRYIAGGGAGENYAAADFVRAFKIMATAVYNATADHRVVYVINASGGLSPTKWDDSFAPVAADMPPNCQFWSEAYDNPNGKPSGYKNYGCYYDFSGSDVDKIYDTAERLGYLDNSDGGTRGWGIGEFCAPRRVAPALSTLNTSLGWGPLSPHDIDGSGQAQSVAARAQYCLTGRAVPASIVMLWEAAGGANWNQSFTTAGTPQWDDGTADSPGLHYQNWPISVSPTKPVEAYRPFVVNSA